MDPNELIRKHPVLFHMAEHRSWESILEHGLLSTTALLDLFEISGAARDDIEASHRAESVKIEHAKYGAAVIRDQKPMSEAALLRCLEGMSPAEWYRLLNSRVFFWPTERRLRTLLQARAYRRRPHTVIRVDTQALLRRHMPRVTISPINSGSTVWVPARRGPDTFKTIIEYPERAWRARGIAELAVDYSVPDIETLALSAEVWEQGEQVEIIWRRY